MIITISGRPGAGKSVVAKALARKLGMVHKSSGDFMRELAKESSMSLLEYSRLAEEDEKIDLKVDSRMKEFGEKEDGFIMDSRLGYHFIPHSLKVFLDVDPDIAAERIFRDKRDTEDNTSVGKTKEDIAKRVDSEKKRYKRYYDIDPYDLSQYDILLDTSDMTIEQAVDKLSLMIEGEQRKDAKPL